MKYMLKIYSQSSIIATINNIYKFWRDQKYKQLLSKRLWVKSNKISL